MTLNQLQTFAAIGRHLNLSRVSAELHVSQSSITQQMRKLENEFKTKLYRKSQRGIVLTDNGQTFLGHVQLIVKQVKKLSDEFGAVQSVNPPTLLRVGGSFAPSASFLPKTLGAFRKRYPNVQLTLKTHDSVTLERMLLDSELDIALLNQRPKSVALDAQPYRRENLVVFASAHHPLAKKRRLTLSELARSPLVIREAKGSQTLIERLLAEVDSGMRPNIVLRCESPAAVKTAVRSNMGLGVLFHSSVKSEIRSGKFRQIKLLGADLDVQTYIVHRSQSLSFAASKFIDILRRARPTQQPGRPSN